MERDFYNEDFEELIKEKTDQYKMYPSDKVWKGVYNSLHARRRRFVIGMSVLISGILIFAGKELLTPGKPALAQKIIEIKPALAKATPDEPSVGLAPFKKEKHPSGERSSGANNDHAQNFNEIFALDIVPDPAKETVAIPAATTGNIATNTEILANTNPAPGPLTAAPALVAGNIVQHPRLDMVVPNPDPEPDIAKLNIAASIEAVHKAALLRINEDDKKQMDWLQERALQHLAPIKQHKLNWQVYFSPTVNYRKLSGGNYADSRSTVQNVPIALIHVGNANDFVDHTPAVGYEVGGSMMYRLTRNLTLKAGLQFNYTRYFIRAYSSMPELATIQLNSNFGYFADSITGYTNVRNFGGKSKEYLQNRYFQLSAPIGLEMRIFGNGKLQFNVAGTIQPTYLLNKNSYLLTTDYSNYTKEPSLFRRWNLNGGLEAFISYQIGGLRWQIGPQFRYQLFSTYTDQYPLKENLMEYGIKIAISKIIR